jgi:hypothetical protein
MSQKILQTTSSQMIPSTTKPTTPVQSALDPDQTLNNIEVDDIVDRFEAFGVSEKVDLPKLYEETITRLAQDLSASKDYVNQLKK